jgi:hypothetical protein
MSSGETPSDGATFAQGSYVTVDFTCDDDPGGLGIIDGGCAVTTLPISAGHEPARDLLVSRVCGFDQAFNVTEETIRYSIVDTRPPAIHLISPDDGATYVVGQQAAASFWCDDGNGSGLSTCKGDLPNGAALDTSTVGASHLYGRRLRPRREHGDDDARLHGRLRLRRLRCPRSRLSNSGVDQGR